MVDTSVARQIVQPFGCWALFAALTDDDRQFALVVDLTAHPWQQNRAGGTGESIPELGEEHWHLCRSYLSLGGEIGIVDANTDDFIWIGYRRPQFNQRYLEHLRRSGVRVKHLTSPPEDPAYGCRSGAKQLSRRP